MHEKQTSLIYREGDEVVTTAVGENTSRTVGILLQFTPTPEIEAEEIAGNA